MKPYFNILTFGLTDNSKNVYYTYYRYNTIIDMLFYVKNISMDEKTAVDEIKRLSEQAGCGYEIWSDKDLQGKRIGNNTMPFGKYVGMKISDIYNSDENHKNYLLWLSQNYNGNRSKKFFVEVVAYADIIRDFKVKENQVTQQPLLPIEKKATFKKLTITKRYDKTGAYGDYTITYLKDMNDNLFIFSGKMLGKINENITVKCKIKSHDVRMGINYNMLKLR